MSKKSITLILIFFIILIAGMFTYAHLKKNEIQQQIIPVDNQDEQIEEDPYSYLDRIDAKHYFIDGTHTLVGEVVMPTPCDLLNTESTVLESSPEQIIVSFDVINNTDSCIQQLTSQRFKVEAVASAEAKFKATFMDRDIILNLVPAGEGEVPEDFELFIKG